MLCAAESRRMKKKKIRKTSPKGYLSPTRSRLGTRMTSRVQCERVGNERKEGMSGREGKGREG